MPGGRALHSTCAKHWTDRAVGVCEDCGEAFCDECLVPPVRKHQPIRCIECALVAAGVKTRPGRRQSIMTNMNSTQKRAIRRW